MTIELRVTLLEKADRSQLGPYGVLLGNETATLAVALASPGLADGDDDDGDAPPWGRRDIAPGTVRPAAFEIMDGIAAAIAKRPARFGAGSGPDVAILPPEGSW